MKARYIYSTAGATIQFTKKPRKTNFDNLLSKVKGASYPDFLKSRYWKAVRKLVLKRDKGCVRCRSKRRLEVHHKTYKHHFSEHLHMEDLETLCHKHHHEKHF